MPGTAVPADSNFAVVRGDAASWTLNVTFPPTAISSNLNTYEITMMAKARYQDPDTAAVFVLTKTNGKVVVDGVLVNVAHLSLSESDTTAVPCLPPLNQTILVYDVEIEGTDLRPYTVARGQITIVADASIAT